MKHLKQKIRTFFNIKTEEEKMNDYLGQAVDRYHLEILEREWFSRKR